MTPPAARRWPAAAVLIMLVAIGPLSTDLYLPSLPDIQAGLSASPAGVQWTLSAYLLAFAACQIFYGPLSDRVGRRPALIGSMALYAAASAACFAATSIEMLVAARFLQAVGGCGGVVVARAVVRDTRGPEEAARFFAHMAAAMALGLMLGPVAGGHLTEIFGWRANFALLGLFGALCLAGAATLGETNRHRDATAIQPRRMMANFATLLRHRTFTACLLAGAFSYGGMFAFISGSAFVFIEILEMAPHQYGYRFAAIALGYAVGSQIGGRLARPRAGVTLEAARGRALLLGGGLCAGAGAAIAVMGWDNSFLSASGLVALMIVYVAGMGMVLPNTLAGGLAPFPRMAGAASSLLGFGQYAIGGLFGLGVGYASDGTAWPMSLMIGLGGALTWATWWSLGQRRA